MDKVRGAHGQMVADSPSAGKSGAPVRVPNALPFSCKGRYVVVDSSTAGAARRPSFI